MNNVIPAVPPSSCGGTISAGSGSYYGNASRHSSWSLVLTLIFLFGYIVTKNQHFGDFNYV